MRKIQFVSIRLQNSDKKAFAKWFEENRDDYYELKGVLIGSGYKFTVSYDPERDVFINSVTGTDKAVFNTNSCFTSRSNDMFEAEMLSIYKHIVLADGKDWDTIVTEHENWG